MSDNLEPDAALMLRVKEGDSAAFTELVDKYKQPVMNLVTRMLRDPTEAEDVAQNVFVQVYRSAHRYETTAKFSTWLFTIARRRAIDHLRRRKPQTALVEEQPDSAAGLQEQVIDRQEAAEEIQQGRLAAAGWAEQRQELALAYLEDPL